MTQTNQTDGQPGRVLRIATRKSPLAIWQAEHVATLLEAQGIATVLVPLVSTGDVDMSPIDGTRQVGVFTKRIQQALVDDEADVAVHSLKDLPTEYDSRFALAAVPERESVFDCLVSPEAKALEDLPDGAVVGTGSRRRAAQLLALRSDLQIEAIRGNVQTRLEKLASENYEAIVLAEAGLLRLEMSEVPRVRLSLEQMLPAPGQGALGIETRSDDAAATSALGTIDHPGTRAAVIAERTLLADLHGGCLAPIAAHATCEDQQINLSAIVLSTDGRESLKESTSGPLSEDSSQWQQQATDLAKQVSEKMISAGARDLILQAR